MDIVNALRKSIASIEKMQDQITALQDTGVDKATNDVLNSQWVRLQKSWELAHHRLAELGAAN